MQNVITSAFETVTTVEHGVEVLDVFMHLSSREVSLQPRCTPSFTITLGSYDFDLKRKVVSNPRLKTVKRPQFRDGCKNGVSQMTNSILYCISPHVFSKSQNHLQNTERYYRAKLLLTSASSVATCVLHQLSYPELTAAG